MTTLSPETMPIPDIDVASARADADRLRRVARLAAIAGQRVGETAPPQWYGGAATSYDTARAELGRCVDDVRRLSRTAAEAVAAYAEAVAPISGRMRSARADLDLALDLNGADPASVHGATLVEQAWRDYDAAHRVYRTAVDETADALAVLPGQISPTAQGPGRHLEAGFRRFWEDAVAEPASLVWDLTVGAAQDPAAWWDLVSSIPSAVADMVEHPLQTVDEAVAGPEWRAGEWGTAIGATVAATTPSKRLRAASNTTSPRNLVDVRVPKPRLQTIEELLVRVDLQAHEHHALGHTIRRHVDVDDTYLEDRLRRGTLQDDGSLGARPRGGKASAWSDLDTAEAWITDTLRVNEKRFREWAVNPTTDSLTLVMPADPSVGRVMTLVDGEPRLSAPTTVKVVLMKDSGSVVVSTAYPDIPNHQKAGVP